MHSAQLLTENDIFEAIFQFLSPYDKELYCFALGASHAASALLHDGGKWLLYLRHDIKTEGIDSFNPSFSITYISKYYKELVGCCEMKCYLALEVLYRQFMQNVFVVRGDIAEQRTIKGYPIDCIAFPTSSSLHNPRIGAAARVHGMASDQLNTYISDPSTRPKQRLNVGDVYVTPAFSPPPLKWLVHCISPAYHSDAASVLHRTYANALFAIMDKKDVQCAAFVSISTGNNQYPAVGASQVAMQAIMEFIRQYRFETRIGFVCDNESVYTALNEAQHLVWREAVGTA